MSGYLECFITVSIETHSPSSILFFLIQDTQSFFDDRLPSFSLEFEKKMKYDCMHFVMQENM